MTRIEYIDQTIRDGQQSLWGMNMRPGHILPVAHMIDRAGYKTVDLVGGTLFSVLMREHREDPWKGLDAIRAALPDATLRAGRRTNGVGGMGITPDAIIELWIRTLASHGVQSMWIMDCLHDTEAMRHVAHVVAECGAEPALQVNFSLSPVHTDEYYVGVMRELAAEPTVKAMILGDETGALSVERGLTWIPLMIENAGDHPIELHFHNTTGQATVNYNIGVRHGATILHTAVTALANGDSLPSTQVSVENMRRLGHEPAIDDSELDAVSEHFAAIAAMEGYRTGAPVEYRVAVTESQIPGGMMGTLRDQLARAGMSDRLDELLDESIRVRAEMGYPIMATPYSQLIGIQALMNVVNGERYSVVPDEVLSYLAGWYGKPPAPMDPDVLDRALETDRGRTIRSTPPPQPTLKEIRAEYREKYGRRLTDEELLLRYMFNPEFVDAMYAARRPIEPVNPPPATDWVARLMRTTRSRAIDVALDGVSLSMRRSA
jgi:oxaloacetate decarboxylase (Na+ extruding) subunit alpha